MFKDEVSGIPINEFIGLRSKMYSYLKDANECGKTAKGIKKNVTKKDIKHENYKDVLFNNKQVDHKMKTIQSKIITVLNQDLNFQFNFKSRSGGRSSDKRIIHLFNLK